MEGNESCIVCGTGANQLCSGCQQVRYCSKAHQKSHWREHKLVCKCYKVECDATTGHYLVAAKDIEAGAIILKEEPLVVFMKRNEGPAVCVSCCCDLKGQAVSCPNCKWPMCGQKKCWGEESLHGLGECSLLKAAGALVTGDYSKWVTKEIYPTILILRCLALRQRNPTSWKKLLEFNYIRYPSCKEQCENLSKQGSDCDMVQRVNRWVPDSASIQETLVNLFFLFSLNSFEIKEDEDLFALYYAASMIDHSCVANATKTITKDNQIIIRASVPIAKGSRITLRFSKAPLFATTLERQLYLEPTKFHRCRCVRCKDPTELGTFASGVYCQKCPNLKGILLSENPLDRGSYWKCDKCYDRKPASYVTDLLRTICTERSELDLHSIPVCEAFISRYDKILHPHHHFIAHVKLTLCYIYCQSHSRGHNVSNEICDELAKKGALVEELLKIVKVLSPGLNSLRGFLLCKQISFVAIKNYKLFLANNDSTEAQSRHDAYLKMVEEIQSIFLLEPEDSSERILANIANQLSPFDVKSFEKLGF